MGMDLYGLNPTNPNDAVKPEQIDWSTPTSEKERDEYFNSLDKYQDEVIGDYFRNNVWWWRPLWDFICHHCSDILTKKDIERGHYNDGRKISKTKSVRIGKRLCKLLADDTVGFHEREMTLASEKAAVDNKEIRKEMYKISEECKKLHGENLAPINFPEPFKTKWKNTYDKHDWDADYPFSAENVENFAKFCLNSGGFEIC